MRKFLKGMSLLLLCGVLALTLPEATISRADSIQDKKDAIAQAKEEKKKLQDGLSDVKKVLKGLESDKKNLQSYVVKLDGELDTVSNKIAELKELIAEKEAEIEKTSKELAEAEAKVAEQYASMKTRIKFMYERGDRFYLDLMLEAESFGDMLNKAEYVEALSGYDNQMLEEFKANQEFIAACKAELEAEEEVLQEAKALQQKQQENLELLIDSKEAEINKTSLDIKDKEAAIKEYEDDIAAQNKVIKDLEAALAAAGGSKLSYDGGMFKWPAPSYSRVGDDFGWRMHPILHVNQFHNGIDLPSPSGSPILAAYDGNVVGAGYNGSMGNYVMIDHGDGLYTIYMHASALYVSNGDSVSKGDKIAAVGSTGRSTGPHLHFGVRLNGAYVSPWNYISN